MVSAMAALAATLPASAGSAHEAGPRGALILVGGGLRDDNAEVYSEIVRRAGGAHARIGVITAASVPPSRDPHEGTPGAANSVTNGRFYTRILTRYGAGAAEWLPLDLDHPAAADDTALVRRVGSMTGFVFGGGDQSRLVAALLRGAGGADSPVLAAIRARFERGAVIAGTSAGAQIQGGPDMVTGGASYQGVRDGSRRGYFDDDTILAYRPEGGFGTFTAGLLDTHFSTYGRMGRAIRLAADTGHTRVFGLDPDTALEVTDGGLRVLGRHGVSVVDLRDAVTGTRGGRWSISGVRWSYLTDGAVYRPDSWTYVPAAGARPLVPAGRAARSPVEDVFDSPAAGQGGFRLVGAALDLAGAGRSAQVLGTTYETNPVFTVALGKGEGFAAYRRGAVTSFTGMTVAVYAVGGAP
jgi:cyanophycinase